MRRAVLALLAFLLLVGTQRALLAIAAGDKCPLHVVSFTLLSRGQTGHVDRFAVGLLLAGRSPVSATMQIPGLDDDVLTPVIGPDAAGGERLTHYVVDVPRAVVPQAIRVRELIAHGASDTAMTCASPPRILAQTTNVGSEFDDSALPGSDLLFPRPVTEARVLAGASAAYPAGELQRKHQGRAVVAVTVGAGGSILGARIETSSGHPLLDDAALAAARRMRYSEPAFNGAPIPLEYLVTYVFRLR